MSPGLRHYLLFLLPLFYLGAGAQKDTAHFMHLYRQGNIYSTAGKIDSSIIMHEKALSWSRQNSFFDTSAYVTELLSMMGRGYRLQNKPLQAHQILMQALAHANKYGHLASRKMIFVRLAVLHKTIAEKDLPFNYPTIAETEPAQAYFSVQAINKISNDSLEITIAAGRLDGILDTTQSTAIWSRIIDKDSLYHKAVAFLAPVSIVSVTNNTTVARVANDTSKHYLVGDLFECNVQVPIKWNGLFLKNCLLNNIYFSFDGISSYYNYRYFYYYMDTAQENQLLEAMLDEAKSTALSIANDTLTKPNLAYKFPGGIFSGENMLRAVLISKPIHQQLFLKNAETYPAGWMGNNKNFTLEFATWVSTGSSMVPSSIKPYLLGITNKQERMRQAFNLAGQIKKSSLLEAWLGEGLQQVNEENIPAATATATLLDEVATVTQDTASFGWSSYLLAIIAKKEGSANAGFFMDEAEKSFAAFNNVEGKAWVKASRDKWKQPNGISISTQSGHRRIYMVAQSPNAKYFATGSEDHLIKIWDKVTGKELTTLTNHTGSITSLHYSPNGKYLVSASSDRTLIIWNAYDYTPLISYTTDAIVYVAKFSPNSKLLYAAEDSVLNVINPFSDSLVIVDKLTMNKGNIYDFEFFRGKEEILFICGKDSTLCKWNLLQKKKGYTYPTSGLTKSIKISNDDRFLASVTDDGYLKIWDLYRNIAITTRKIHLQANYYSNPCPAMFAAFSFSANSRYFVYPISKDSFQIVDLLDLAGRIYKLKTDSDESIRHTLFSKDGKDLMITSNGYKIFVQDFQHYDIDKQYNFEGRRIKFFPNIVYSLQYTADNKGLWYYQYGLELAKIDLSNAGYYARDVKLHNFSLETKYIFLNGDSIFVVQPVKSSSSLYLYRTKDTSSALGDIELPDKESIISFDATENNQYCFIGTKDGLVFGWDIPGDKQVFATQLKVQVASGNVMVLYYDKYGKRIFTPTNDTTIVILNAFTGLVIDSIKVTHARNIVTTPNHIYITNGYGKLQKLDAHTLQLLNDRYINNGNTGAGRMVLSPNNKYLVIQNTETSIMGIDTQTDSILYNKHDHNFISWSIAMSTDGKEFATAGGEGSIFLYETATGKKKASIQVPYKKDPLIIDEENHYLATKNTLEAVNIYYNNNAYDYNQFDVQLNRPDIVLQKLGRADTALIRNYYNAYKKRMKRIGLKENADSINIHLPAIKLKDRFAIGRSTTAKDFVLTVQCMDAEHTLQNLQVLVNNSPVLGVNGRDLSMLKTRQATQQVTIPLAKGSNTIKIFCTNSKGAVSLRESFNMVSTYNAKPKVYFIGIGVERYKDSSMNLTYSAKDIRDLAKDFSNYAENVEVDTLLNENVTKENINKLRKKLLQTSPNDRVIIAVTGHGMLSDSLNFYYATYDINFSRPELRGIPYETLEALLDDVPAQEKIMFIDACHSGALDKDELLAIKTKKDPKQTSSTKEKNNVKSIASRSSIKVHDKQAKVSANSSFELMQHLFSDLSGSNGAVVISAAGGMEYAFESPEWNNGVFTYSIREGIFSKFADKYYGGNNDGNVTVQELANYVNKRVSELTSGKQRPTSRRENIEFNWVIKY